MIKKKYTVTQLIIHQMNQQALHRQVMLTALLKTFALKKVYKQLKKMHLQIFQTLKILSFTILIVL